MSSASDALSLARGPGTTEGHPGATALVSRKGTTLMTETTVSMLDSADEYLLNVRVLTVHQPWATAITKGWKSVENRAWPCHRGVGRILIHAGQHHDRRAAATFAAMGREVPADTPTGTLLAVADVAGVCQASVGGDRVRCGCGGWAAAWHFHWQLTNVIELPEPVKVERGWQKLWRPRPEDVAAVAEQLRAVWSVAP